MTNPRLTMSPQERAELDAWIAEQHKHFQPSDLDSVVDVIRKSDRLKAMAAARERAA